MSFVNVFTIHPDDKTSTLGTVSVVAFAWLQLELQDDEDEDEH
jgi:hypothetical protein